MKKPLAIVGDVIIADMHPVNGVVMFEVAEAWYDDNYSQWHYRDRTRKRDATEQWVVKIYRRKGIRR